MRCRQRRRSLTAILQRLRRQRSSSLRLSHSREVSGVLTLAGAQRVPIVWFGAYASLTLSSIGCDPHPAFAFWLQTIDRHCIPRASGHECAGWCRRGHRCAVFGLQTLQRPTRPLDDFARGGTGGRRAGRSSQRGVHSTTARPGGRDHPGLCLLRLRRAGAQRVLRWSDLADAGVGDRLLARMLPGRARCVQAPQLPLLCIRV